LQLDLPEPCHLLGRQNGFQHLFDTSSTLVHQLGEPLPAFLRGEISHPLKLLPKLLPTLLHQLPTCLLQLRPLLGGDANFLLNLLVSEQPQKLT
jgi:hypothetical protein